MCLATEAIGVKHRFVSNLPLFSLISIISGRLTSSDVEPIGIVRSEFLVGTGLDDVDPSRDFKFTY